MAKKFEWVFKSPRWSLKFEALLFGALLWWTWLTNVGVLPLIVWVGVSALVHFRSKGQRRRLFVSFALLLAVALTSASLISNRLLFAGIAVSASLLFYLLRGIKEYYFIERPRWYGALSLCLIAWAALLLFAGAWPMLLGIAVYVLLMHESLRYLVPQEQFTLPYLPLIFAVSTGVLLYELSWAIRLLPVGFITHMGLFVIFFYTLRAFLNAHSACTLTSDVALRLATFVMVFGTTLLLTSRWAL